MDKEKLLKSIMKLPKVETNNSISAYGSINVDDLMSAVDRLNKVPTYDELLKENKKQKEVIDKIEKLITEYLGNNYSIYYENEIECELINDISNILKED